MTGQGNLSHQGSQSKQKSFVKLTFSTLWSGCLWLCIIIGVTMEFCSYRGLWCNENKQQSFTKCHPEQNGLTPERVSHEIDSHWLFDGQEWKLRRGNYLRLAIHKFHGRGKKWLTILQRAYRFVFYQVRHGRTWSRSYKSPSSSHPSPSSSPTRFRIFDNFLPTL
jgi:hypothetical protein